MKKSQLNIHKKINLAPNSLDCLFSFLFFFFCAYLNFHTIMEKKKRKEKLTYNDDYGGMFQDYVSPY